VRFPYQTLSSLCLFLVAVAFVGMILAFFGNLAYFTSLGLLVSPVFCWFFLSLSLIFNKLSGPQGLSRKYFVGITTVFVFVVLVWEAVWALYIFYPNSFYHDLYPKGDGAMSSQYKINAPVLKFKK